METDAQCKASPLPWASTLGSTHANGLTFLSLFLIFPILITHPILRVRAQKAGYRRVGFQRVSAPETSTIRCSQRTRVTSSDPLGERHGQVQYLSGMKMKRLTHFPP